MTRAHLAGLLAASLALWAGLIAGPIALGAPPLTVLLVLACLFLAGPLVGLAAWRGRDAVAARRRARARARVEAWLAAEDQARRGELWTEAEARAIAELEAAQRAASAAAVGRLFDRTELADDPATVIEAGDYPPPPATPATVTLAAALDRVAIGVGNRPSPRPRP